MRVKLGEFHSRETPDLVTEVLEKCIETAGQADDHNYEINIIFEFLDDTYHCKKKKDAPSSGTEVAENNARNKEDELKHPWENEWLTNSKLKADAFPYTTSSEDFKANHPLMLMVKEQRIVRLCVHHTYTC